MIVEPHSPAAATPSIHALLGNVARQTPHAPALIAQDGAVLTYGALRERIDAAITVLRECDVAFGDRIAIVLPNGTAAAVAFLAAASAGVACPLNPANRRADFDFAFDDLQPRALITHAGSDSPAVIAACARGMQVIDVGYFATSRVRQFSDIPRASDIALMLHTSGTTARPKMVPLTHANLCTSAANIANWLELTPADRCLNVMPLFHIHGLIGALLSSLAAGASVVCSDGFVSPDFFAHLRTHAPTWYTAVPTIHQSILARAATEPAPQPLRLVRSSSAPLPPATARALATLFAAPVIEAYGMTEAAHQMCSNPLAPGEQRYGSVGLPAGPEVAILDTSGGFVVAGAVGEVAIRGANVTSGYVADPAINAAAFTRDWFHTGDLGRFDGDGYLYLAGRIKELINRGGEKIAPREIDDVLMNHPAVAQAVAFAIPDVRLGEEVGAAVVLKPDMHVDESALIRFAANGLADWKVPRRIAFVSELPKGPTGKLVRNGLAARLGLDETAAVAAAALPEAGTTEFAEVLAEIWRDVLKHPIVDADADFLALGGDSVLAGQVIARVRKRCGRELSILAFFERPTLISMAVAIAESPVVR